MRTVRYLIGAVAVCRLAAVEPASAQQVTYVSQTDASVEVSYSNLPANTELLYANEVTGAKGTAIVLSVGGSGAIALPMPPGPGRYSVMAREGGDWLAQTVVFYSKDTAASGDSAAPSGNWSVTITIDGQVTSFSGGATDGTVTYSTPPPPPTNYLLDDMQGYILDSIGAKLTTSP